MKVGLVFDDSLDKTDGVAQYVLITGQWLVAHGHDVHYLVGQTRRTDLSQLYSLSRNLRVRFNKNRMSMPLPAGKKQIRELLMRENFDILHVQMPYSPALAGRIISAAGKGTAVVGTFHILPYSKLVHAANRLLGAMQRRTIRRFDAVMSTSPPAAAFAKATFGVDATVVPLGIPLESFLKAKPFPDYKETRTIVTVGRLVPRKGCQHLLSSLAILKDRGQLPYDVCILICGDGHLRPKLEQFVRNHGLDKQVSFEGFISEEDKPRYLASADIAVYPSTGGESFGIVLLEAMAAARGAVLGGNNPGYASVIGSRKEALFDPIDHAALAERLNQLLENPKARDAAHKWQQEHVKQFSVEVVGKKIETVYKQALRRRAS